MEIRNKKAAFNFSIGEKLEVGIILQGTEVKSIRAGHAQINEAFVRIEKGKAMLYGAQIEEYAFGNEANHPTRRPRELLLKKRELLRIEHAHRAEGYSIIPIKIYFKGSLIKLQIALCKSKKNFDKRDDMKKKTQMREAQRSIRDMQR